MRHLLADIGDFQQFFLPTRVFFDFRHPSGFLRVPLAKVASGFADGSHCPPERFLCQFIGIGIIQIVQLRLRFGSDAIKAFGDNLIESGDCVTEQRTCRAKSRILLPEGCYFSQLIVQRLLFRGFLELLRCRFLCHKLTVNLYLVNAHVSTRAFPDMNPDPSSINLFKRERRCFLHRTALVFINFFPRTMGRILMVICRNENVELRRGSIIVMLPMFAAENYLRHHIDISEVNLSPRRLAVGNPTILIAVESIVEMDNLMYRMSRQNRRGIRDSIRQQGKILMLRLILLWNRLWFGSDTTPTTKFGIVGACLMTDGLVPDNQFMVKNPHCHVIKDMSQRLRASNNNRLHRGKFVSFRYQSRPVNTRLMHAAECVFL